MTRQRVDIHVNVENRHYAQKIINAVANVLATPAAEVYIRVDGELIPVTIRNAKILEP